MVKTTRQTAYSRMTQSKAYSPIHPTLPITTLTYPVAHGCTSHGIYESSAVFIRYDRGSIEAALGEDGEASLDRSSHPSSQPRPQPRPEDTSLRTHTPPGSREFLFFGDVESDYRASGDEEAHKATRSDAGRMNGEIWDEAARSWNSGRLAGIFVSRVKTGQSQIFSNFLSSGVSTGYPGFHTDESRSSALTTPRDLLISCLGTSRRLRYIMN